VVEMRDANTQLYHAGQNRKGMHVGKKIHQTNQQNHKKWMKPFSKQREIDVCCNDFSFHTQSQYRSTPQSLESRTLRGRQPCNEALDAARRAAQD